MSSHIEQVASTIQRAVQTILQHGLNDPRIRGLLSVTRVNVAPDLSQADVFVSVHPPEHADLSMRGLQSAARHIRWQVSHSVRMRRIPRLMFHLDTSLKKQADVIDAINQARRDDSERLARRADASPTEEPDS